MKNLITLLVLFCAATWPIQSQVRIFSELGFSPGQYPAQAGLFINRQDPLNEFYFNVVRVKQQRYAGLGVHVPLNDNFFMEGGVTYTRQETQYLAQYTYQVEFRAINTMVINESVDQLYLPMDIGAKIGPVEVTSGLKLMSTIKSNHEFSLLDGFSEDKKMINMGWQMGVRAGINGLKAGVEFNGSLKRTCEDRYVNSNPIAIRHIPGRFVFLLQFRM